MLFLPDGTQCDEQDHYNTARRGICPSTLSTVIIKLSNGAAGEFKRAETPCCGFSSVREHSPGQAVTSGFAFCICVLDSWEMDTRAPALSLVSDSRPWNEQQAGYCGPNAVQFVFLIFATEGLISPAHVVPPPPHINEVWKAHSSFPGHFALHTLLATKNNWLLSQCIFVPGVTYCLFPKFVVQKLQAFTGIIELSLGLLQERITGITLESFDANNAMEAPWPQARTSCWNGH